MLRIIGGKFKSRLIKTPKSLQTRPTSSLVRKAFFDICRNELEECQFLDLFAGSGAMGIEAISRGAAHATFVEANKHALACIQDNLKSLKIEDQATVIRKDVLTGLKLLSKLDKRFNLVYIDPPYEQNPIEVLAFIDRTNLIDKGGIVFLEEKVPSKIKQEKEKLTHLIWREERKFGTTVLNQFIVQFK